MAASLCGRPPSLGSVTRTAEPVVEPATPADFERIRELTVGVYRDEELSSAEYLSQLADVEGRAGLGSGSHVGHGEAEVLHRPQLVDERRERRDPDGLAVAPGQRPRARLQPLEQLDAQVVRITVTELRDSTFYASITVQQNGSEIEIDSRPSDAIALAVRAEAPIFAASDVIEESAIEFEGDDVNEEEIVDEFKKFLDDVSPDQFAVDDEQP